MAALRVVTVATTPFEGQKPGTSGLRKTVKEFQKPNYTENFIQSTLLTVAESGKLAGSLLIVGGDGRYYGEDAVKIIVKMCAAHGVRKFSIVRNIIVHSFLFVPNRLASLLLANMAFSRHLQYRI